LTIFSNVEFKIKAFSEKVTKTVVKTRDFELVINEPKKLGDITQGFNPVEFILAAFAGFLKVVEHLVVKEMDIEINKIEFKIEGKLNPVKFMGKNEEARAGYKEINIDIDSDYDQDTINKWLETFESRCLASDNLGNDTSSKVNIS